MSKRPAPKTSQCSPGKLGRAWCHSLSFVRVFGVSGADRRLPKGFTWVLNAVVVSGSLESDCGSDITTPDVLALHGKLDGTIGLNRPRFIKALGLAPRPAVSSLVILTMSAGCDAVPATSELVDAELRQWAGCRGGGSVQAQLVPEAGHSWSNLDASRRTLAFLDDHLLAR